MSRRIDLSTYPVFSDEIVELKQSTSVLIDELSDAQEYQTFRANSMIAL